MPFHFNFKLNIKEMVRLRLRQDGRSLYFLKEEDLISFRMLSIVENELTHIVSL